MRKDRQLYLDSLRGLAALIVVAVHFTAAFSPYALFGNQGSYIQYSSWEKIFTYPPFGLITAGYFAICLFFILSGYVLTYNYLGETGCKIRILAAIVKRPIRLGGLVLFTIIVAALLWNNNLFFNVSAAEITTSQSWFGNYWRSSFHMQHFIYVVLSMFKHGNLYNPPLWTIDIELEGSIMVFLFVLLFGNAKYRMLLMIVLLLLLKGSLFQGFILGMMIADLVKNYNFSNTSETSKFISIPLLIVTIYFSSYPHYVDKTTISDSIYWGLPEINYLGGGYPMLGAFLTFVLVITSTRIKQYLEASILQFLGRISYGLYLVHFLVIGSFSSWLFIYLHELFSRPLSIVLVTFISLPIIILISYLVTLYIDEPSTRIASYFGKSISNLFARFNKKFKLHLR